MSRFPTPQTDRSAVGSAVEALDTPALLLDLKACDRNLATMAALFEGKKCKLRPHFKNHKCTTLARRQLAAGSAVGMTCAKAGEAEVLAAAGVDNILIANQVVGPRKVQRLVDVARKATVRVAVDDLSQAKAISQAADSAGLMIGLLVEVDVGMGRCGVQPGPPALELVQQLVGLPGVQFWGIQAFEGHAPYENDPDKRKRLCSPSLADALETRRLIEEQGIEIQGISGGSSSTYPMTCLDDGFDELQCGTYATMDWRYHEAAPQFEIALSILTTVISRPRPDVAVLDLGVKGAGGEFGPPKVLGHAEAEVPYFLSEEHTIVNKAPAWPIGKTVQVVPSHACTTCNLYGQMHVHEDGKVVDVWPIEGAGRLT